MYLAKPDGSVAIGITPNPNLTEEMQRKIFGACKLFPVDMNLGDKIAFVPKCDPVKVDVSTDDGKLSTFKLE
jgi:hypothetical protein